MLYQQLVVVYAADIHSLHVHTRVPLLRPDFSSRVLVTLSRPLVCGRRYFAVFSPPALGTNRRRRRCRSILDRLVSIRLLGAELGRDNVRD